MQRLTRLLQHEAALRALLVVLAVLPTAYLYRDWFDAWSLPERGTPERGGVVGDLTPQFAVWHRVAQESLWDEDTFPLWNRYVFAGEPFFAKPQVAVIATGTLFGALFRFPLSLKLDILFHVVMLALGMVVLARRMGASAVVAGAVAAVAVLGKVHTFHLNVGHLNFLYGLTWTPWLWWATWRALDSDENEPTRYAAWGGIFVALQVLDGADVTLTWGYPAVAFLFLGALVQRPCVVMLRRAFVVAAVVLVVALTLSAVRLIPMLEYLSIGNRREGVPWAQASAVSEAVGRWVLVPFACVLALTALSSWRKQRGAALALTLMVTFAWLSSENTAFYRVLYDLLPLFRDQRIPQRAMWLVGMAVPLLMALGNAGLRSLLPRFRLPVDVVIGAAALVAVVLQVQAAPARPSMLDVRKELDANVFMQRAAWHAGDDRLNLFENEGRHWGAEHVTVPRNLEVTVGYEPAWIPEYLSPQFYLPQQLAFLDAAARRPARTWGLVSTSVVGSMTPRNVPGFQPLEVTPRCPNTLCMPAKSAGPYLYRNTEALPRVFSTARAALFIGTGRDADVAYQALMLDDAWDPRRVALLRAGLRGNRIHEEILRAADVVIVPPLAEKPTATARVVTAGTPEALDALRELSSEGSPLKPAMWRRDGMEYQACPGGGRFLVFSTKHAMVPGWVATDSAGTDWPVTLANGAATAVLTSVDNRRADGCVTLRYRPRSVLHGALISLTALPMVMARLLARRREAPRT
ncbi:MAG: hypothetical protein AB2A00_28535 [Myxococcota bacterium]